MGVSLVGESFFLEKNAKMIFLYFLCISGIIFTLQIITQIRKLL